MSETMFYILLSLQEERHGYGIMQYVKELTKGRIGKLESEGLIAPVKEIDRRKFYVITDIGKQILLEEAHRIKEMYHNVEGLL